MYYEDKMPIPSFEFSEEGVTIHVNPENENKRFEITNGKTTQHQNLNDALTRIKNPEIRTKLKKKIFKKVKHAFYKVEEVLPDSTAGPILFLQGKDYRTSLNEGIYTFNMSQYLVGSISEPSRETTNYELGEHLKKHDANSWPTRIKVDIKLRGHKKETEWLSDPYQLINIFTNNVQGKKHKQKFITPNGKEEEITFQSSPRYNRVVIKTTEGELTQSYQQFQKHLLKNIKSIVKLFVDNQTSDTQEYVAATYILNHWDNIYKQFNETEQRNQQKLMDSIEGGIIEQGKIPWEISDLLAAGVQEYFGFEHKEISFEESSKMMQMYTSNFAQINNISVDELITNLRQDPLYMSEHSSDN